MGTRGGGGGDGSTSSFGLKGDARAIGHGMFFRVFGLKQGIQYQVTLSVN